MYGKFFASTFTGSMFGAGAHVFSVWGYVIANAVDGTVEVNPNLLASVIGTDAAHIQSALDYLCAPDPKSRTDTDEGRRLVYESGYQYRVVNHAAYRAIRNEEDRRAYNREAQRKHRASKAVKPSVNDINELSNMSAHTEAEADTEAVDQEQDQNKPASHKPLRRDIRSEVNKT